MTIYQQKQIEQLQGVIDNLRALEKKHRESTNAEHHRANRLQAENERLLGQIRAIVVAYDGAMPLRTADWHGTDCDCLRCNIDNARAALAQKEVK